MIIKESMDLILDVSLLFYTILLQGGDNVEVDKMRGRLKIKKYVKLLKLRSTKDVKKM